MGSCQAFVQASNVSHAVSKHCGQIPTSPFLARPKFCQLVVSSILSGLACVIESTVYARQKMSTLVGERLASDGFLRVSAEFLTTASQAVASFLACALKSTSGVDQATRFVRGILGLASPRQQLEVFLTINVRMSCVACSNRYLQTYKGFDQRKLNYTFARGRSRKCRWVRTASPFSPREALLARPNWNAILASRIVDLVAFGNSKNLDQGLRLAILRSIGGKACTRTAIEKETTRMHKDEVTG